MNADIMAALNNWAEANKRMREAVVAELDARAALVALAFPAPLEGTNNAPLGNGWTLQGKFKNNYKLDSERVEGVLKSLPKPIATGLIKWDADLRVGAYKKLEPAHKALVNEVLTITPGRPALELVEPKER